MVINAPETPGAIVARFGEPATAATLEALAARGAQVLDLEDLAAKEPDKYATFWKEFGRVLKEGLAEDRGNAERIAKLLRFTTTQSEGDAQTVSLWVTREYVRAAPGGTGEAKCGGNYAGSLIAQAEAVRAILTERLGPRIGGPLGPPRQGILATARRLPHRGHAGSSHSRAART